MSALRLRAGSARLGAREVLRGIDLDVEAGEVVALIGPNGAGKSTLVNVLAGDVALASGSLTIDGRDPGGIRSIELARLRSMLPQATTVSFPFPVREVIAMGRAPWVRTARGADDEEAIAEAIEQADVAHLLERTFTSLSGGERARVSLARVLAQRTPVVFLDEPTAALDLRHQEDVMRVARERARAGAAVVVVLHDLSLAAAWSDRLVLVADGTVARSGTPAQVLDAELLERVYGLRVAVVPHAGSALVVPVR